MRNVMVSATLGVGLLIAGPTRMALGTAPAAAQFHGGGGGFHAGGGFRGGGGLRGGGEVHGGGEHGGVRGEGFSGYRGGYGGFRGGYYGGYRSGYYGSYRGGYYGGFGYGYGCCGYYGGAGFLLGAAAVAGVTALAVDSAYHRSYYDRTYYDPGYVVAPAPYYPAPVVPAGEYRPTSYNKNELIERCARAAESDASAWASTARFVRVETFDRDGPSTHVDGVLSVGTDNRYDRDGFPQGFPQNGGPRVRDVRFTCALDGGEIINLKVDRPNG